MSTANGVHYLFQEGEGGGEVGGAGGAGGESGDKGDAGKGGAGDNPPWYGTADAETVAYVEKKGWAGSAGVIKSYREAEKFIGRDPSTLAVLPRSDDAEGQRALFAKLGMPADPKGYNIDTPEDMQIDPAYQEWARSTFHELGLTAQQAEKLSAKHNQFARDLAAKEAKDYDLNVQSDKAALERDWGGGYDRMMSRAKLAVNELGFSQEAVDALEDKLGYAGVMKFFAGIGGKLGEDRFAGGDGGGGTNFTGKMTPAEARQAWDGMKLDANEMKALQDPSHPGHSAAKTKQTKLFQVMYPE
jgi:hypothetical protein